MFVLGNFLYAIATISDYILTFANWLIIIRAILSWVNPDPYNALVQFLYKTTEPLLAPFRKIIPAYSMGIDFSPIFALLFIWFVKLFLVKSLFGIAMRISQMSKNADGRIGIIGGSGLYSIEGMKVSKKVKIKTPFGEPSDEYVIGSFGGVEAVFLTPHGKGHRISPSEVNYCANIYGMKWLGVDRIISVSACGSLRKELKPLDIVIPDQFVDRTSQARKMTFFQKGIVAHIQFSDPICPSLAELLFNAGKRLGATMHKGGTYLNMEGPQFSTRAESELYRSWGVDIIGMTNIGEARLAREAEICYATLACITDYGCWHQSTEEVSVEMIIANLMKNVSVAKNILSEVLPKISEHRNCVCSSALKDAIVTDPKMISPKIKKDLNLIIGKYIK